MANIYLRYAPPWTIAVSNKLLHMRRCATHTFTTSRIYHVGLLPRPDFNEHYDITCNTCVRKSRVPPRNALDAFAVKPGVGNAFVTLKVTVCTVKLYKCSEFTIAALLQTTAWYLLIILPMVTVLPLNIYYDFCTERTIVERSKILLDTNLKIISLDHQNNFVGILQTMSNAAKVLIFLQLVSAFYIIILIVQQIYFSYLQKQQNYFLIYSTKF